MSTPAEEEEEVAKEAFKTASKDGKGILVSGVSEETTTSSFWTSETYVNNSIIMSYDKISEFNRDITQKVPTVYDIKNYKETISKTELTNFINNYKVPTSTMYDSNSKVITKDFYNNIVANTNLLAVKDITNIRYALTIKKANIRSFPTDAAIFNSISNKNIDRFQESGCEACEPVLILHESKDGLWYFVQIYNYRGWMKAESLAITPLKSTVFNYVDSKDFLMVTGRRVTITTDTSDNINKDFPMGTKLILEKSKNTIDSDYIIKIPLRDSKGQLSFTLGKISSTADVCIGYLPYTRYNIVTQAFKLQGLAYDWGDKGLGRDCSSFIMYTYKCFGFMLPRNTDEQEICSSNIIKFKSSDSYATRVKALSNLEPGATLYMPGHTMLYLGEENGTHYMIHAFLGYSKKEGSSNKFYSVYQVAVSTIDLANSEGTPFLLKLTSAERFEY